MVEEIVLNLKWFKYDLCILDDCYNKCLKEFNIDELWEVCNGCVGVLCYLLVEFNFYY